MLNLQAIFERNVIKLPVRNCVIGKIIELPESEYQKFKNNLMEDYDFIRESDDDMILDRNGLNHCILTLGEGCSDGVLIIAEGCSYARYTSLVQGAREYVTARLNQLADQIIREGTQETRDGAWSIPFDKIQERYNVLVTSNNGIGSMLLKTLEARPETSEIDPMEDSFDIVFYPTFCPNLSREPQEAVTRERQRELLDRLIGYIGEHFSGGELYDILHNTLEMSLDEMESIGFDLQSYADEQDTKGPGLEQTM